MTLHGRRTCAAVLAMGLTGLVAAGCGDSGGSGKQDEATAATPTTPAAQAVSDGPVRVTLGEWAVKPSATRVKAGDVRFIATNSGSTEHEMVVIRTDRNADDLGSGARIPETGSAGEISEFGAGKVQSKTLKLKPGHYALVCNIPGHYAQGMRTDFEVLQS
jgi:uncharacterized cupredoxin-like copper-binding protein